MSTRLRQARTSQAKQIKRILAFGDSLTFGNTYNLIHDPPPVHPYTLRLQQLLQEHPSQQYDFQIDNAGVRSELAQNMMTKRLPKVLRDRGPYDLAIILGGMNDLGTGNFKHGDEKSIFEAVRELHLTSIASGAKTLLLTIPESDYNYENMGKDGTSFVGKQGEKARVFVNEMLREFAENTDGVTLCDLDKELPHTTLSEEDRLKYCDDGLHYTPEGNDRMGELIFERMKHLF